MSQENPTTKEIYELVQKHTAEDDIRFATLATKNDLDALNNNICKLTQRMQPLIDLLSVLNNLNRFLKWGGITFFAFLMIMYFIVKK